MASALSWDIWHGDCRTVMQIMPANYIDSIVGDPPYGLGFMGAAWDKFGKGGMRPEIIARQKATEFRNEPFGRSGKPAAPSPGEKANFKAFIREVATECLRVLKPGGHVLLFGGTRTYHWLVDAWEDAGFEIRDQILWLYGTGFPKNLNVSKAIDKGAGVEPIAQKPATLGMRNDPNWNELKTQLVMPPPTTPEAIQWEGWGTALKPAVEPIMLARKPFKGAIYKNVLKHETGAINIDGCRVGENPGWSYPQGKGGSPCHQGGFQDIPCASTKGRHPANIILSHSPGCTQAGIRLVKSGKAHRSKGGGNTFGGENTKPPMDDATYADATGNEKIEAWECVPDCPVFLLDEQKEGASRFFYCAKPNRKEKDAGLAALPSKTAAELTGRKEGSEGLVMQHADGRPKANPFAGTSGAVPRKNTHSTVKPIRLLRYLARLVTPPNGIILDPFAGSGSQGCAAVLEGFRYLGIEQKAEYVDIARARIAHWAKEAND